MLSGRAGGIRTRDLLNPIQAHYQAVLRPEIWRRESNALSVKGKGFLRSGGREQKTVIWRRRDGINCVFLSRVRSPTVRG